MFVPHFNDLSGPLIRTSAGQVTFCLLQSFITSVTEMSYFWQLCSSMFCPESGCEAPGVPAALGAAPGQSVTADLLSHPLLIPHI